MKKNTDPFRRSILLTMLLLLLLEGMPVTTKYLDKVQIFEDGDYMFNSGNTYYAISPTGVLVGWGSNRFNRIGGLLPWYPYCARKIVAKDVSTFSCGTTTAMYVDNDHVLWGWGTNENLILSNNFIIPMKKRIMENVRDVAVGYESAAAIKTDGSLWTWGRNTAGQLGNGSMDSSPNGMRLNDGRYYPPQKIMDHVKKVKIIDDIPFAITESNDLYVWGMRATGKPIRIAERVRDVSYTGIDALFQYLNQDDDVCIVDVVAAANTNSLNIQHHQRIAENAKSLCNFGLVKKDGTFWTYSFKNDKIELNHEKDGVWAASDQHYFIGDTGRLYTHIEQIKFPMSTHSIYKLVPVLRDVLILMVAFYLASLHIKQTRPFQLKYDQKA